MIINEQYNRQVDAKSKQAMKTTRLRKTTTSLTATNHHHLHKQHANHSKLCIFQPNNVLVTLVILVASSSTHISLAQSRMISASAISTQNDQQQQPVSGAHHFMMLSPTDNKQPQQSTTSNSNSLMSNYNIKSEPKNPSTSSSPSSSHQQQPQCNLGNDTYQLGERWNPTLPPFGVQVCVQCECIVRQRKTCYESKVTCRRITNECPIIDSCPDGKRPVTIAGQCCKSCQSTNTDNQSETKAQWAQTTTTITPTTTANNLEQVITTTTNTPITTTVTPPMERQINYKNDRVKEYQAIVKALPACPKRDGDRQQQNSIGGSGVGGGMKPAKSNKPNDLNGIDSRLAFKSLDPHSSYLSPHHKNRDYHDKPVDDTMRHDHQHPNDVQSGAGNQQNYEASRFAPFQQHQHQTTSSTRRPQPANIPPSPNTCILGTEVFQIGDRWNPVLPPLGVQVCVLCNCIVRQRKLCYEAKVTCRRINNDCPIIETCPDGKKPVTVAGQCCKSCQSNSNNNDEQDITTTTTMIPERLQKNDRVMREYQSIMKSYPACMRMRGDGNSSANATVTVKRSYNS